jgi:hypothetical protein
LISTSARIERAELPVQRNRTIVQQVGVKAGANFGSLTPEEGAEPDTSWRPGPVGGHINTDDHGDGDRIKNRVSA